MPWDVLDLLGTIEILDTPEDTWNYWIRRIFQNLAETLPKPLISPEILETSGTFRNTQTLEILETRVGDLVDRHYRLRWFFYQVQRYLGLVVPYLEGLRFYGQGVIDLEILLWRVFCVLRPSLSGLTEFRTYFTVGF